MPNKTLLVTGGAGFIGSNFVPFYLEKHSGDRIINLDKLTYAGHLDNLTEVTDHSQHVFVHGDICNAELIDRLFKEYGITDVIHFAAESHVDRSIKEPDAFIKTNVQGTFELLKACLRYWPKSEFNKRRFHYISTDEVFGTLEKNDQAFTETSPFTPNNPYSASKASAAMLARSYQRTFGLNILITHCSNNYGPKQHGEKFIPTIIRQALSLNSIPIYGDGQHIRDWLFVRDHCEAIDFVFERGKSGESYNVGANNERVNIEIVEEICGLLDVFCPAHLNGGELKSFRDLITWVPDRPGHDRRYAINSEKLRGLGWQARTSIRDGLRQTVEWYANRDLGLSDASRSTGT